MTVYPGTEPPEPPRPPLMGPLWAPRKLWAKDRAKLARQLADKIRKAADERESTGDVERAKVLRREATRQDAAAAAYDDLQVQRRREAAARRRRRDQEPPPPTGSVFVGG